MVLLYNTTAKILRTLLVLSVSCLLLNFAVAAEQNIKSIKVPASSISKIQQPGASYGGAKAETDGKAERRIPATLRHRDRAVTAKDYKKLGSKSPDTKVHRARARSAVGIKTPRKLSTARLAIAQYKNCTALTALNKKVNASLDKASASNRLVASLRRNKRNTRLASTIRRNIASLRAEIRTIKSMVARMELPASCRTRNRSTATHRRGRIKVKEDLEEARERYKLALRILTEHAERMTQVVQKITS